MSILKILLILTICVHSQFSYGSEKFIAYSYNSYILDSVKIGNFPTNKFTLLLSVDASRTSYIKKADAEEELEVCDNTSEFICFIGMDFHFAILKKNGVSEGIWKHKNRVFKTDGELKQLTMFGKTIEFYFITSTFGDCDNQQNHYYLYSEEKGLLAVQMVYGNLKESYELSFFLEQKLGFGYK
jgi:hypothetical protein